MFVVNELNKRQRKPKMQPRMNNPETQTTSDSKYRTKTYKANKKHMDN